MQRLPCKHLRVVLCGKKPGTVEGRFGKTMSAVCNNSPGLVPALHEVLTGDLASRYGALPMVPLPGEDELLIGFIHNMGSHLRGCGLYRRDYVYIVADESKRRFIPMTAESFVSWSQSHVATSKTKYDGNGQPYTVCKDMPTVVAKQLLESKFFGSFVEEIEEIYPVPLPKENGLELFQPGYEDGIFTFGFGL